MRMTLPVSRFGALLAACLLSAWTAAAVPVKQVEVIHTYPHDPEAFTQGLVCIDGVLYEGTGRNGVSQLRKVELATGKVQQSTPLAAQHFGEGITVFNNRIYQLTWQTHLIFVYDFASLQQVQSFYLPGEGWGVTHDDKSLIVSDGTADLRFLDPATLKETGRVQVTEDGKPLDRLNELEYINGEVWANVWYTDFIVRIDPKTGVVKSKLDLHALNQSRGRDDVLNGIAYDAASKRLFVTGKLWNSLYEIKVKE
ncbi:MAG TPA: glutaminyl-peptide cyclotransferase [Candidatus Acidoferrum sp.]|nr:glutaminyl-peptide cyclotransferase [Candidatus Acidoferrum sp.]